MYSIAQKRIRNVNIQWHIDCPSVCIGVYRWVCTNVYASTTNQIK